VRVQPPAQPEPTVITTITNVPPAEVPPVAAPHVEAPPAVEPALSSNVAVVCPNIEAVKKEMKFPPQAIREGLSGEVLIEFTVGPNGELKDVKVVQSTNRIFNTASLNAVKRLGCIGRGQDVRVQAPFAFNFKE
jgi:protein TonB